MNLFHKIGIFLIVTMFFIMPGDREGIEKGGGFLWQWGFHMPIWLSWILAVIIVIGTWWLFANLAEGYMGVITGLVFGGLITYVLLSTMNPDTVFAYTVFNGLGFIVLGTWKGIFGE